MKSNLLFFLLLLSSCENEKQDSYREFDSSDKIELVDQNFDIEEWADQKITQNDKLNFKTGKIVIGGNDILIPIPAGFVNASDTYLGENLFSIFESPTFNEYLFFIREEDYQDLSSDDFNERWQADPFICGVRTLKDFEQRDFSKKGLAYMLKSLQEQSSKILEIAQDTQKEAIENINHNAKDLGISADYKVLDSKILPPFDIEDDSFSILKLLKSQIGEEDVNEIILMNYLNLNQRFLVFYITSTDASDLEFMKRTMRIWVKMAFEANY